ncbi:hypothetical protein E4T50_07565 [Aureobasidium sp. EXF-12298]|nr:hypothetical protein E4T50_07565 [Aureobasidium sp. EXF-12298]KAI4754871.1 hypothetical protein E4T51_12030 [Aureobasidium sp. EXF-12344]KAI4771950.1 hypothetical protein E4T52_13066 [Aureobasidium sp. EXF-3400]
MCHHFARSCSPIIRTRCMRRVSQFSQGTGRICKIIYVSAISKGVYEGKLSNGEPFAITKAEIRAEPKTYQLRKEPGHHNCYRLVCRLVESYRELRAIGAACGPKQRDMPNRAKTVYHLCNGERVTDLELKQDEDVANYDIVAIKDSDGEITRKYLRETCWIPVDDATPSDRDED